MAQITNILPVLAGQTLDADIHRLNFNNIIPKYNEHDRNKTGIHGIENSTELGTIEYYTDLLNGICPVGSILEFWDNEIAAVKALINSSYFIELAGSTISDVDSLFNGTTLPDDKESYLMTVNTEVIDNSFYFNTSNEFDFSHIHTLSHTHDFDHVHTVGSHTHAASSTLGYAEIGYSSTYDIFGTGFQSSYSNWTATDKADNLEYYTTTGRTLNATKTYIKTTSTDYGSFGANSSNITSSYSLDFDTNLSATQDLRPISNVCRRYLRIK